MIHTISSRNTFFLKYMFTGLWIVLFGFGTIGLFATSSSPGVKGESSLFEMNWFYPVVWVLGSLYLWWGYGRLKRVRLDERNIYISNYFEEIEVPLQEVTEVRGFPLYYFGQWVTLKFRNETRFGTKVEFKPKMIFMPTLRWPGPLNSPYPVVDEIRAAVEKAQKA